MDTKRAHKTTLLDRFRNAIRALKGRPIGSIEYGIQVMRCDECDRDTALAILKEFSRDMRPDEDLFGNKTLVINRDQFEAIRKKYLDRK